jgi:hypothetical protein
MPGLAANFRQLRKLACPGIHDDHQRALTVRMDCRVKPGNDEEKD